MTFANVECVPTTRRSLPCGAHPGTCASAAAASGLGSAAARGLLHPRVLTQTSAGRTLEDYAQAANAFCAAPSFNCVKCGFASKAEESATVLLGLFQQDPRITFTRLPENLPAEVVGGASELEQKRFRPISLACQGPVVVRSVFKILKDAPPTYPTGRTQQGP